MFHVSGLHLTFERVEGFRTNAFSCGLGVGGGVLLSHTRCFFPCVENLLAFLLHSLTLPREGERVFYLMC